LKEETHTELSIKEQGEGEGEREPTGEGGRRSLRWEKRREN